ncbi:unnamed protein product, partial [Amoebophrya sp. A25]
AVAGRVTSAAVLAAGGVNGTSSAGAPAGDSTTPIPEAHPIGQTVRPSTSTTTTSTVSTTTASTTISTTMTATYSKTTSSTLTNTATTTSTTITETITSTTTTTVTTTTAIPTTTSTVTTTTSTTTFEVPVMTAVVHRSMTLLLASKSSVQQAQRTSSSAGTGSRRATAPSAGGATASAGPGGAQASTSSGASAQAGSSGVSLLEIDQRFAKAGKAHLEARRLNRTALNTTMKTWSAALKKSNAAANKVSSTSSTSSSKKSATSGSKLAAIALNTTSSLLEEEGREGEAEEREGELESYEDDEEIPEQMEDLVVNPAFIFALTSGMSQWATQTFQGSITPRDVELKNLQEQEVGAADLALLDVDGAAEEAALDLDLEADEDEDEDEEQGDEGDDSEDAGDVEQDADSDSSDDQIDDAADSSTKTSAVADKLTGGALSLLETSSGNKLKKQGTASTTSSKASKTKKQKKTSAKSKSKKNKKRRTPAERHERVIRLLQEAANLTQLPTNASSAELLASKTGSVGSTLKTTRSTRSAPELSLVSTRTKLTVAGGKTSTSTSLTDEIVDLRSALRMKVGAEVKIRMPAEKLSDFEDIWDPQTGLSDPASDVMESILQQRLKDLELDDLVLVWFRGEEELSPPSISSLSPNADTSADKNDAAPAWLEEVIQNILGAPDAPPQQSGPINVQIGGNTDIPGGASTSFVSGGDTTRSSAGLARMNGTSTSSNNSGARGSSYFAAMSSATATASSQQQVVASSSRSTAPTRSEGGPINARSRSGPSLVIEHADDDRQVGEVPRRAAEAVPSSEDASVEIEASSSGSDGAQLVDLEDPEASKLMQQIESLQEEAAKEQDTGPSSTDEGNEDSQVDASSGSSPSTAEEVDGIQEAVDQLAGSTTSSGVDSSLDSGSSEDLPEAQALAKELQNLESQVEGASLLQKGIKMRGGPSSSSTSEKRRGRSSTTRGSSTTTTQKSKATSTSSGRRRATRETSSGVQNGRKHVSDQDSDHVAVRDDDLRSTTSTSSKKASTSRRTDMKSDRERETAVAGGRPHHQKNDSRTTKQASSGQRKNMLRNPRKG